MRSFRAGVLWQRAHGALDQKPRPFLIHTGSRFVVLSMKPIVVQSSGTPVLQMVSEVTSSSYAFKQSGLFRRRTFVVLLPVRFFFLISVQPLVTRSSSTDGMCDELIHVFIKQGTLARSLCS